MILSIVLPCYNEAKSLPLLLDGYLKAKPDFPFELILVNNGSTDESKEVMGQLLCNPIYSFARIVEVEKNQGYGFGIITGLKSAKGDFLAFSHADMQCAPKDVFLAFEKLRSSVFPQKTLVKGRRQGRGLTERTITFFMALIASLVLGKKLSDINAQPKVFPRAFLQKLAKPPFGFELDLYILYQAKRNGFSVETIPVEFKKRLFGVSHWAFSVLSKWKAILKTIGYIFKLKFQKL